MKIKITKFTVMIIAAAVISVLIIAKAFLPQPLKFKMSDVPYVGGSLERVEKTEDEVTVRKAGDDFKVIMFTDTHFDGKNKTSKLTLKNMINNIVSEKPDLVIFDGDNITSALNRKRAEQLCEIFEKLGIYWAGGLGNHEGDNAFSLSREKMVDIFSSYEHCLMIKGPQELPGTANYALTILNRDNSLKHTYFFMDTGDEMTDEQKEKYGIDKKQSPYDGTKEEQVKWYESKNNELKKKYGDFKSTVVIHIPLPQMKEAAERGAFLYGDKRENVCASGFDSGLFEAMFRSGTTESAFFGHDHMNDFGLMYRGILLSYIQPSGYGSYTTATKLGYKESEWIQGYTVLNMAVDGTFDVRQIKNSAVNTEKAE